MIEEEIKHKLTNSGSRISIMYGFPKVHKPYAPFRLILSTINSYNYSTSELLVKTLCPLCHSEYSVRDSSTFVRDILCVENQNYVMASFDIVSLFTCIPVEETYNIITSRAFNNSEMFCGYSKKLFKRIFDICCKGNTFTINDKLYKQTDVTYGWMCYANARPKFHEPLRNPVAE